MYLTQNDLIKMQIEINAPQSALSALKDIISDDQASTEKKEMHDGKNYYQAKNDISNRHITYFINDVETEDNSASNNKLIHSFHKILVDQKVSYVVGNPIVFDYPADNGLDDFNKARRIAHFDDIVNQWVKGASNKGQEWIHFFVNDGGELEYIINPAEEIIPIYDTRYQKKLLSVIRYYEFEYIMPDGKKEARLKVEWWDDKKVTYFEQDDKGNFVPDTTVEENPANHFTAENSATGAIEADGWGRPPFVCLLNNDEAVSDLRFYKTLIDDYDLNASDMSNNLADIQEAIWVLMGYEGEDLAGFVKNLKRFKVIKVAAEEHAGAESKSLDIPTEARDSHLDRLQTDIYTFGQGVDPNSDKFGNSPSGIALKRMYALLDLKAALIIRKLKPALQEFAWFINKWLEVKGLKPINVNDLNFVFNESMIVNEAEKIESLQKSKGLISDETIVMNHPYVDDPAAEMEKLAEQKEAYLIDLEKAGNDGNDGDE